MGRQSGPRIAAFAAAAAAALLLATLAGARAGLLAGKRPATLGLSEGRLAPVPEHLDNAVSSIAISAAHQVEAIEAGSEPRKAFERLSRIVAEQPGASIVEAQPDYLHAEFETKWLRFVDDVEFALDEADGLIHVRSASRIGRRDFGVNRRRIESIRRAFEQGRSERPGLQTSPPGVSR